MVWLHLENQNVTFSLTTACFLGDRPPTLSYAALLIVQERRGNEGLTT